MEQNVNNLGVNSRKHTMGACHYNSFNFLCMPNVFHNKMLAEEKKIERQVLNVMG